MGVPIIRTIVFWGLYWGPSILGNYHIGMVEKKMETNYLTTNTNNMTCIRPPAIVHFVATGVKNEQMRLTSVLQTSQLGLSYSQELCSLYARYNSSNTSIIIVVLIMGYMGIMGKNIVSYYNMKIYLANVVAERTGACLSEQCWLCQVRTCIPKAGQLEVLTQLTLAPKPTE